MDSDSSAMVIEKIELAVEKLKEHKSRITLLYKEGQSTRPFLFYCDVLNPILLPTKSGFLEDPNSIALLKIACSIIFLLWHI